MDCLCQIVINQKLSHKFKKWCKFSSHVKVKSRKTRPAGLLLLLLLLLLLITFMHGIYNYIPETHHVSRVYSVAAIL
jgi:hypothetical protein